MAQDFRIKLTPQNQSFTLKNTTVNPSRLDRLADVSEPDLAKVDGSILMYEADTDTYVLKDVLRYNEDVGGYVINGGSF